MKNIKNRNNMKKSLLFILVMVLTSCISNQYKFIDMEKEFKKVYEVENKYILNKEWWTDYNNKDLNKLVELALNNNANYIKSALNINIQLYKLNLNINDLFPTLYGDTSGAFNKKKDNSTVNDFSASIGLSYQVDLLGKVRNARDAQKFEYKATVMDMESAKLTLINSVVDFYFNIVYVQNSIEINRKILDNQKQIYQITSSKYEFGYIEQIDLLKEKQNINTLENNILNLEIQLENLQLGLKNILNMKDNNIELKSINLLDVAVSDPNINAPLSILAERPDVKANELRLEKAFKNLEIQNKNWYPTITLGASYGSSGNELNNSFSFPYTAGNIKIDLPFLDWNRVKNNIKISEGNYEIAKIDFQNILIQAVNEVNYYYFTYKNNNNIFYILEDKYNNNKQISTIYQNKYKFGSVALVDLLNILNAQYSSEIELLQQKYKTISSENMIHKAIGGKYIK